MAATDRINERQKLVLFDKVLRHFAATESTDEQPLRGRTVALWGLSFKPETDDIREAPAIALCERLVQAGATVRATDPVAMQNAERRLEGRVQLFADAYEAASGADALLLCTEWRQYRQPNFRRLRDLMRGVGIFDGRNIWSPADLRAMGFTYAGIGRKL